MDGRPHKNNPPLWHHPKVNMAIQNRFYCHECAARNSLMNAASPVSLTGTQYQLERFIKHTAPTGIYPVNSIFDDPTYNSYRNYVISSTASGCVQVDSAGRVNVIYVAGKTVGITVRNSTLVTPDDAVKVVLHDNQWKMHAFPTVSDTVNAQRCVECGRLVAS
jgi:hypothetical protein